MRLLRVLAASLALPLSISAQGDCTVTTYGPSCGPVASGAVTPQGNTFRFAFTIDQAKPRTPVVWIVGIQETSIPLLNSGCLLLTDFAFLQSHRTDATGTYTASHAIPAGHSWVGQVFVQFVEADLSGQAPVFRSTNGVKLVCK